MKTFRFLLLAVLLAACVARPALAQGDDDEENYSDISEGDDDEAMGGGEGMPDFDNMDPEELQEMMKKMGMDGSMGGMGGGMGGPGGPGGPGGEPEGEGVDPEVVRAALTKIFEETKMAEFTEATYDELSSDTLFVVFPWAITTPEVEQYAEVAGDVAEGLSKSWRLFQFNADAKPELKDILGIAEPNHLYAFFRGPDDYSLRLTLKSNKAENIFTFLDRFQKNAFYEEVDEADLDAWLEKHKNGAIVARFAASDSAKRDLFTNVCNVLGRRKRATAFHAAIVKGAASATSVSLHRNKRSETYSGEWKKGQLLLFFRHGLVPVAVEAGPESFDELIKRNLPIFLIFHEGGEEATARTVDILESVGAAHRSKMSFSYADGPQNDQVAPGFGLDGPGWPRAVLLMADSQKKFLFPTQGEAITEDAARQFIDDFFADKLVADMKSQDVPETQDGPVLVGVYKNWESLVVESKNDVLIEFYAPWCGHCKQLAPIYAQLGEVFADVDVDIVKYDADSNAVPDGFDIQGFPTLKYRKDGEWKDVEAGRDLDSLYKFVVEQLGDKAGDKAALAAKLAEVKAKPLPKVDDAEDEDEDDEEEEDEDDEDDEDAASAKASAGGDDVVKADAAKLTELIASNDADAMVMYYAPWCGHCKQFAPKYKALAKKFADDAGVVIAKVDGTKTEHDELKSVQGFPTIMFYAAGSSKGVEYDGARTVAALANWIEKKRKSTKAASCSGDGDKCTAPPKEEL